jgi:exonuclease III
VILVLFLCQTEIRTADDNASGNVLVNSTCFLGFVDNFVHLTARPTTVLRCPSVYNTSYVLLWACTQAGVPFRPRPQRSLLSSFVAFLLLSIESNPGPPLSVNFGVFNAGGAASKGETIQDLICDHRLDVLAVSETWIRDDAPDAIKLDMVPPNFAVLHAHHPCAVGAERARHGGRLAFIHSTVLPARTIRTDFMPASFELQLVGLQVGNVLVKVENIYRPPSSSKAVFLEEFSELLTSIGLTQNERLVICGDFNLPGADEISIDSQLSSLLDVHGYQQHVTQPTRHDASRRTANLLDVLITTAVRTQSLVSNVQVHSSHGVSDHSVVVCVLCTGPCASGRSLYIP